MEALRDCTVTFAVDSPALVGVGISLFDMTARRDAVSGAAFTRLFDETEALSAAASLLVEALRHAGHHHYGHHGEMYDGDLTVGDVPQQRPVGVGACDSETPDCPCDTLTALAFIEPAITPGTPVAALHADLVEQFTADMRRTDITVTTSLAPVLCLTDAVMRIIEDRYRHDRDQTLATLRTWVLRSELAASRA